ncbi:related to MUS81 protein, repair of UV-and methylation-induced DNA damage [Fusarium fujikuroi IMI 58289]|uniref:Crossover junction endonuclease MUS81 n=1 Tax=Gibberella fujikuroi (strain CBS 195.34 / IMI 58289 / NRRL A-6831) TaxID=1279085 RepID=S0DNK4_GIBF5|nr:related to MUS81 protein, repair of UV-and methylation-induced DNA damage [Fusarium fujikuroi IMI 58289]KLP23004.1 MUS81 protein, repair of UV-and methylation-induced DNA damage [Fusarium fujikuroi]CCT62153.1 related to MUS81 protein, repair of UV-and methylation-induced DNA damage [Fusarium fujikuroi IMI 58289]SCN75465.1 related to MUS81 protein, repair of UV-and methylation-induced DNA damage [Fusarium fujikuroi]SCO28028.1 related to MUS81 protein, repair of UV-and methylation-induced DNA 
MDDADSANPQLLAWVKEWLDLARERNSKGVTTYRTAYNSLKACPITFEHPAQLQQLKGFGPKLCERLEQQLKKHCEQNGLPMPPHPRSRKAIPVAGVDNGEGSPKPAKKARKPKAYVPALRSGAFALVVGLSMLDEDSSVGMTKAELIEVAQPHCDSSFSAPSDPTKFYTAWNSMKTLLQKELVYERGRPLRRYALTDEGWEVAKRIKDTEHWQAENGRAKDPTSAQPVNPDCQPISNRRPRSPSIEISEPAKAPSEYQNIVSDGPTVSDDNSLPNFTPIRLPPGSFTVHLVLDVREVRAKTDRDYMQEELAKLGAKPIMRSMELGDAQWIAKCHDPNLLISQGAEGAEVVLDWIVERKRLDDLIGSIKDGRFHEQKFRLQRSGVRKVIYIIEEISMDPEVASRYAEAVRSAIASTQVVNGYFVKRTAKMDDTVRYLARMTAMLKRTYESKPLNVIPTKILTSQNYLPLLKHLRESISPDWYITYPAFSSLASKSESITLRDVFLKMLMTTKGITGERALEIQKRWKTPYDFVKAFEACGSGEQGLKRKRELVFSQTSHLVGRKKFTKPLSTKIAEVWGDTL